MMKGKTGSVTKKRIIAVSIVCLCIITSIFVLNIFIIEHNVHFELVDEVECENKLEGLGSEKFFIKDDDLSNFYDGKELLEFCAPYYDQSNLDIEKYTYLVTVNRKVKAITYSGRKCLMRTHLFFPDEYVANVDCEETNDKILRIYRMKKLNIDYDYHAE